MRELSTNILDAIETDFASYVKTARVRGGWSLKDVAERTGGSISKAYVGHLETGHVTAADLTLKKLIILASGLGVPVWDLIEVAIQDSLQAQR